MNAAFALRAIVDGDADRQRDAIKAGVLALLCQMARSGGNDEQRMACSTIPELMDGDPSAFATPELVALQVELLRTGDKDMAMSVTITLLSVAHKVGRACYDVFIKGGVIDAMVELLRTSSLDDDVMADAMGLAALMLALPAENDTAIKDVILDSGAVVPLVKLLSEAPSPTKRILSTSVLRALDALAVGNGLGTRRIVEADTLAVLVETLRTGHSIEEKAYAALLIGTLAKNDDTNKQTALDAGAAEALVALVRGGPTVLPNTEGISGKARALNNLSVLTDDNGLCKQRVAPAGALPALVDIFRTDHSDHDGAAAVLARIAVGNGTYAMEVAQMGALELLVAFARASVTRGDLYGVRTSLDALAVLSASKHNQDELLNLGVEDLLTVAGPINDITKKLAAIMRWHLGFVAVGLDEQSSAAA